MMFPICMKEACVFQCVEESHVPTWAFDLNPVFISTIPAKKLRIAWLLYMLIGIE